jgi:hypothetical protein
MLKGLVLSKTLVEQVMIKGGFMALFGTQDGDGLR